LDDVEEARARRHSVVTVRVAQTQSSGAPLKLDNLRYFG